MSGINLHQEYSALLARFRTSSLLSSMCNSLADIWDGVSFPTDTARGMSVYLPLPCCVSLLPQPDGLHFCRSGIGIWGSCTFWKLLLRNVVLVAQMVKNLLAMQETPGLFPGSGRSPGEGNGNPLQYCLENSMDRGAWWDTVHGVTKNQTRLSE